jgi:hypothetical protein
MEFLEGDMEFPVEFLDIQGEEELVFTTPSPPVYFQ